MKKNTKITTIILLLFMSSHLFSQDDIKDYDRNFKLGVGLNVGLAFNDPYKYNIGGDVRLQYNLSKLYSLSLTTGINNIFTDKGYDNLTYIPVKVGYKSFIMENELYIMGEIGGAFSVTNSYKKNSLLFAPTVGYATKYIDISIRYESLKSFPIIKNNKADEGLSQIFVRLAYGFDL